MQSLVLQRFVDTRRRTEALCQGLTPEDCTVQPMPDASPIKWHLAHTTWFFEKLLLQPRGVAPYDSAWQFLFNSYYESFGPRQRRDARGLLTRPTLDEVMRYRQHVTGLLCDLLGELLSESRLDNNEQALLLLGCQHEEQHQELMLTDAHYLLWSQPLQPAWHPTSPAPTAHTQALKWERFDGGMTLIGSSSEDFSFDNERPEHRVYLDPFSLASRLVTNDEFQAFVADEGYQRPEFWLSDGYALARTEQWERPLYWQPRDNDTMWHFTLAGWQPLLSGEPVTHISYYEADAYARWYAHTHEKSVRLPSEAEWEHASRQATSERTLAQMFNTAWQWTQSAYQAYPGFEPFIGALGEYNAKFMCNQYVLRGSSWATPPEHSRRTYRNFFSPDKRWQVTGIRLARRT